MLDTLRNAMLASLGLVAITQEKLKGFVDEWVKRGELTAEQGKKLFDELLERSQVEGRALSERVANEVVRVLEKTPVASKRDLRQLEERVKTLESRWGAPAGPAGATASTCSGEPNPGAGACGLDEDVGV